jgi:hypothetical protein
MAPNKTVIAGISAKANNLFIAVLLKISTNFIRLWKNNSQGHIGINGRGVIKDKGLRIYSRGLFVYKL